MKSFKSVLVVKDYRLLFWELEEGFLEKVTIEMGLIK